MMTYYSRRSPPQNNVGITGFVFSVIGLLTCGLLCPLGLFFSFFGLFYEPKGLSIAGFIIGAVGTAWLFLGGFILILGLVGSAA